MVPWTPRSVSMTRLKGHTNNTISRRDLGGGEEAFAEVLRGIQAGDEFI